jgi:tRNA dimethylallyltransferase
MQPKLVAVVGPTGTGKSDLALDIAESIGAAGGKAEIINSDSMQFYRGMDIGTAKLPIAERRGIEHHMLDVLSPRDESTAAEYQRMARPVIEDLQSRGVVPILVGGSMLYVAAVLNTFEFPARDEALRAQLEAELDQHGSHELYRRLAQIDPDAATRVDSANPRRVVRALEIVMLTGEPFAAALPEVPENWQPVLELGLNSERAHLVQRLERRVELMWQKGLLEEVEALIPQGFREGKTSSRAIGYAQALSQLDGLSTQEEAIAETVRLTQRYARRQMSWFRRDQRIQWFDYQDADYVMKALDLVHAWLAE